MKRMSIFLVFLVATGLRIPSSAAAQNPQPPAPAAPKAAVAPVQKSLSLFSGLVPGVDMFASSREILTPFIKPLSEGVGRLKSLIGEDLPKGAFILCNSAAEKDSVSDEKYIRLGYRWVLTELTPEATRQQRLEMIKARFAAQGMPVPDEVLSRMNSSDPKENERNLARQASRVVSRTSLAAVSVLFQPDKVFRSSRIEDLSRSPLSDWLDMGLSNYVSGSQLNSVGWVKQRIEEVYPLEDLLQMNEPFVAPSASSGSGGGGGMMVMQGNRGSGGASGGSASGSPPAGMASSGGAGTQVRVFTGGGPDGGGAGGGRGGGRMQMPQEMIDKMNFDNQATLVFAYFTEVLGVEKMKTLINLSREGKDVGPVLEQSGFFGKPLSEIEKSWLEWVKTQKAPEGGPFRMM